MSWVPLNDEPTFSICNDTVVFVCLLTFIVAAAVAVVVVVFVDVYVR